MGLRSVFPSLEDLTTGDGQCLISRESGEAALTAGIKGLVGFSFRDVNDMVVLPKLDAQGRLPIVMDIGTTIRAVGKNLVGSLAEVTIATIALTANKVYDSIAAIGSCPRDTLFTLVQNNNAVLTEVGYFFCGPGTYSFKFELDADMLTAGATGTQELLLKAINTDKLGSIWGNMVVNELP